jgi:hypothetical protein
MKKTLLIAAALAALAPSAALADGRPCLREGFIYSWNAINDKTLIVEDQSHVKFRLGLMGVCSDLKFHERLAFKAVGGMELSCLSTGDEVITREFGTGERLPCAITKVEYYTPEMQAADKAAEAAAKGH